MFPLRNLSIVYLICLSTGLVTMPLACSGWESILCKYSIRDVGFVNVHGKTWQVQLLKPPGLDGASFEKLDATVRRKFQRTNVSHLWIEADSEQAGKLLRSVVGNNENGNNENGKKRIGFLVSPDGAVVSILPAMESDALGAIEATIDDLIHSPIRKKILAATSQSLCAVVLFCSGEKTRDNAAVEILDKASQRLQKQMWMLEKPTDSPPVPLVVDASQQNKEKWLMYSLGVEANRTPAVVILYGQGRRLGGILAMEDLTAENIVGQASVCGRDCECDLDRNWLYGHQMIHQWTLQSERAAENTLNFDPHASLVIAEVAQIIRKNNLAGGLAKPVNLGPGLIIHDLEPIVNEKKESKQSGLVGEMAKKEQDSVELNHALTNQPERDAGQKEIEIGIEDPNEEVSEVLENENRLLDEVPFTLFGLLVFGVVLVFFLFRVKTA